MKAFKTITNPNAFDLLADETRRRVIYLLRAKEMTVAQIASELGLTPQAIYHHIRKLREADMVEVAKEERVDHFIETYYRATAEVFHLSHGEGTSQAFLENKAKDAITALQLIGLKLSTDPTTIAKIVDLEARMETIGEKGEVNDRIADLDGVDFFTKQSVAHYAKLLAMTDAEANEYCRLIKEHRRLVKSMHLGTVKA